jgi:hypothetical protein
MTDIVPSEMSAATSPMLDPQSLVRRLGLAFGSSRLKGHRRERATWSTMSKPSHDSWAFPVPVQEDRVVVTGMRAPGFRGV